MTRQELIKQISTKQSYLCVGLDTDPAKLPASLRGSKDGMLAFNKAIIDATKDHCIAYKINTAFYEAEGLKGWEILEQTAAYIPASHLRIADAKRGDIGNTSARYAKAFFEEMPFDAITVAPYMGRDSLQPFLDHKNKWTIVLGLTSNTGAADFELQQMHDGHKLYEKVLATVAGWGSPDNLMFVIGATQTSQFENIRKMLPEHFFLVPGVGAQGGSLADISAKAANKDVGLLVNASRAIIYASPDEDFAEAAGREAASYAAEMKNYIP